MTPQTLALIERYDALTRTLEDQVISRVNKRLDEALRELEQALVKSFDSAADLPLLAASRRAVLMEQLSELLQVVRPELADEYERIFTDMVAAATRGGGKMGEELMAALAPKSTFRQFAGIPVEAIAAQARDGVRRLYRYNDTFRDKASAVVEMGLAQGKGTRWVAAELRREVGVTKSKAEAIARTETLAALNTGAEMAYQDNGIDYVSLQTTADDRTCPICVARSGKAYKRGDISVPLHPLCRCFLLPWSPTWGKAGIFNEGAARSLREQSLKELAAAGKTPNNGLSPFEKAAGMTAPPKAVWTPGGEEARPEASKDKEAATTSKRKPKKDWDKSWSDAPADLEKAINQIGKPSVVLMKKAGAFYDPSDYSINIGPKYDPDKKSGQNVYRHEYGHYIDNRIVQKLNSSRLKELVQSTTDNANQIAKEHGFDDYKALMYRVRKLSREALDPDETARIQSASKQLKAINIDPERVIDKQLTSPFEVKHTYYSGHDEFHNLARKDEQRLIEREARFRDKDLAADPKGWSVVAGNTIRRDRLTQEIEAEAKRKSGDTQEVMRQILIERARDAAPKPIRDLYSNERLANIPDSVLLQHILDPGRPTLIARLWDSQNADISNIAEDLIGSLTRNKVGVGHSEEYYAQNPRMLQNTEAFANIIAMHGDRQSSGGALLNLLAPNSYRQVQSVLREIGEFED